MSVNSIDFKFIKRNWRKDKIPEFCKRPLANSFVLQTVVDCFEKKKSPFFHFGERMNRTDRKVMIALANRSNPMADRSVASSTLFSSIKRLLKQGYVIKTTSYELEDPFFGEWILGN